MSDCEGGRADLQIILPVAEEAFVEALLMNFRFSRLEALGPKATGFRVILTKREIVIHPQAGCARLSFNDAVAKQHTAGKDILPDVVGRFAISVEETVAHGDGLNKNAPAFRQVALQDGEILRPVTLADRLDHLNGNDIVECSRHITVIAQLNVGATVEAAIGPSLLTRRDGHASDVASFIDSMFGKAAPAATDFKDAFTVCQPRQSAGVFIVLSLGQVVVIKGE